MVVTAKIEKLEDGKLVLKPDTDISRFVEQKRPRRVEVRLDDGRTISVDQRRKIFAIIRDISLWSGHEPEELRQYLEWDFCSRAMREWFSLSDCDMTTARECRDMSSSVIRLQARLRLMTKEGCFRLTTGASGTRRCSGSRFGSIESLWRRWNWSLNR